MNGVVHQPDTEGSWHNACFQVGPCPPVEPAQLALQKPQAHLIQSGVAGERLARCSLWWEDTPSWNGAATGLIGHFESVEDVAGTELVKAACQTLLDRGCQAVLGPMDGSTWFRYRWVTKAGDDPPFLLEPWNPPAYPQLFLKAGLSPVADYESSVVSNLLIQDPRLERVARRMGLMRVQVRPLATDRFEEDLEALHELSLVAFQHNLFYTPIGLEAFKSLYLPYRDFIRPEFTRLAFHEGKLVGFCFSMPDFRRLEADRTPDTLIVKTIAIRPERRFAGLGSWLVEAVQHQAAEAGMTRAIHALKAVTNASQNITVKYRGSTMRRYQLFGKILQPNQQPDSRR